LWVEKKEESEGERQRGGKLVKNFQSSSRFNYKHAWTSFETGGGYNNHRGCQRQNASLKDWSG
jgi:hypothetical protein